MRRWLCKWLGTPYVNGAHRWYYSIKYGRSAQLSPVSWERRQSKYLVSCPRPEVRRVPGWRAHHSFYQHGILYIDCDVAARCDMFWCVPWNVAMTQRWRHQTRQVNHWSFDQHTGERQENNARTQLLHNIPVPHTSVLWPPPPGTQRVMSWRYENSYDQESIVVNTKYTLTKFPTWRFLKWSLISRSRR